MGDHHTAGNVEGNANNRPSTGQVKDDPTALDPSPDERFFQACRNRRQVTYGLAQLVARLSAVVPAKAEEGVR